MSAHIWPLIAASCEFDPALHPLDVREAMDEGAAVFATDTAVLVARIIEYPRKKTKICEVLVAGGYLPDLLNILRPETEQWARDNNCTHCTVEGRTGWARVTKQHGYTANKIIAVKSLGGDNEQV